MNHMEYGVVCGCGDLNSYERTYMVAAWQISTQDARDMDMITSNINTGK